MHEGIDYITLPEAAKLTPNRPSTNCLWRWCRKGVTSRSGQRVRLQHVRIGGKLYTTSEWLRQFGQCLAQADAVHFDIAAESILPPMPRQRTDAQRQAAIERAERELAEAGV